MAYPRLDERALERLPFLLQQVVHADRELDELLGRTVIPFFGATERIRQAKEARAACHRAYAPGKGNKAFV